MKYPRIVEGFLVKDTGAKGYGFFAQRSYKKGEIMARVKGAKIKDTDPRLTHRGVQIGPHTFIEPRRYSLIWYLNHCCNPNAYMDMDKLVARRAIAVGEEITTDYSLFTNFTTWDMDCECKHQVCRKLIVPFSRLKPRPKQYVSKYLQGKSF